MIWTLLDQLAIGSDEFDIQLLCKGKVSRIKSSNFMFLAELQYMKVLNFMHAVTESVDGLPVEFDADVARKSSMSHVFRKNVDQFVLDQPRSNPVRIELAHTLGERGEFASNNVVSKEIRVGDNHSPLPYR